MTVNEEWYNYISSLHQLSGEQSNKLTELEEKIKMIEEKLNQLDQSDEKQSKHTIDKIEYHFDQLKIDHLNGALHIGLSPEDLNLDDLKTNDLEETDDYSKDDHVSPNRNDPPNE